MSTTAVVILFAFFAVGLAVYGLLHWLGHVAEEKSRHAGWRGALWALIGCAALFAGFGLEHILANGPQEVVDSIGSRPCQVPTPGCPGYDYDLDSTSSR
jgi:hypothetical protein